MQYKTYPLTENQDSTRFQFQSIGKNGVFDKVVLITPINRDISNLALLDVDPFSQEQSDSSVTDNGDMGEVLATVLNVVKIFLAKHPDQSIYFEGNTSVKTRLYQIVINKVFDQVTDEFVIYGLKDAEWLEFEPNVNYEGFLIEKKP